MDELTPMDCTSTAYERECPTCGAEPGQMCSTEEPGRSGFGIEHATLIHRSRD